MAIGTAALVALAAASGQFEMPVVAGDRSAGLSVDGQTAVLAERPAQGRSRFAVIDAERGHLERIVSLRGDFGFDAMSPDGSTMYVIHYLSRDHRRYAVQAMDTSDQRAALETIAEKGEPGERMSGLPITRATSPDGSWVYTLYDGAGHKPFVHALQASERFTVCIDLEALEHRHDLASLKLALDDGWLTVTDAKRAPLVRVNTASFEVSDAPAVAKAAPAPTPAPATSPSPQKSAGTSSATVAIAAAMTLGLIGALALATASRQRQRRRQRQRQRQGQRQGQGQGQGQGQRANI